MIAPKDTKVRIILFKIYFGLFKKLLETNLEEKVKIINKKTGKKS